MSGSFDMFNQKIHLGDEVYFFMDREKCRDFVNMVSGKFLRINSISGEFRRKPQNTILVKS